MLINKKKYIVSISAITTSILFGTVLSSCSAKIPAKNPDWITTIPAHLANDKNINSNSKTIENYISEKKMVTSLSEADSYKNNDQIWSNFFKDKDIANDSTSDIDVALKSMTANMTDFKGYINLNKNQGSNAIDKHVVFMKHNSDQVIGDYNGQKTNIYNLTINGLSFSPHNLIEMKNDDYFGLYSSSQDFMSNFTDKFNYLDTAFLGDSPTSTVTKIGSYEFLLKFKVVNINGQNRILSLPHFTQNNHYDNKTWNGFTIKKYFKNVFSDKNYNEFMKDLKESVKNKNSIFNKSPGIFMQYLLPLGYWEIVPIFKNVAIMVTHSNITPFAQTASQLLTHFKSEDKKSEKYIGPLSIVNSNPKYRSNKIKEENAWNRIIDPRKMYKPRVGYFQRFENIIINSKNVISEKKIIILYYYRNN